MTVSKLYQELDRLLMLLLSADIALATTSVIESHIDFGVRRVTFATNSEVPPHLFRNDPATLKAYREWIECGGYSAVLYDGSLMQLSYDFDRGSVTGHRLLYFPCPYNLDLELLKEFSLIEAIELYEQSGAEHIRLRSPMRFDFSPKSAGPQHPAAHMTFQRPTVRVPVVSPLSPGRFVKFIFENFYPELWHVHSFLREWPDGRLEPVLDDQETTKLHLSVRDAFEPVLTRA